jgi:hypothetical protein
MFRIIKESENVDERQHCFLIQTVGGESRCVNLKSEVKEHQSAIFLVSVVRTGKNVVISKIFSPSSLGEKNGDFGQKYCVFGAKIDQNIDFPEKRHGLDRK